MYMYFVFYIIFHFYTNFDSKNIVLYIMYIVTTHFSVVRVHHNIVDFEIISHSIVDLEFISHVHVYWQLIREGRNLIHYSFQVRDRKSVV